MENNQEQMIDIEPRLKQALSDLHYKNIVLSAQLDSLTQENTELRKKIDELSVGKSPKEESAKK
ncbi:hypothetical protein [Pseudalkalibacillus caeni]|uniref:Uncharacterized protein n=1 Tax=Exobacillus caeni TaxID=2574798 RepID=A0A5R9F289_9BACL|nr:hypothetical protein [Pseudalkalibacillus caeni]TLS37727.1 hypothetical protein FCL54_07850 [Pseudalkalibacillus caeni]